MFVLTVDQIGSRRDTDRVAGVLADGSFGAVLGPDRTAGDEFQLVHDTGASALGAALRLSREGRWSVGLGVGAVVLPLPPTTREGAGDAFTAARSAVEAAKRDPLHVVIDAVGDPAAAADVSALLQPVLELRARRSAAGWEAADLLADGLTQRRAAERLGVSAQAVSLRVRAAGVRLEEAAVPALARLLDRLDAAVAPRP